MLKHMFYSMFSCFDASISEVFVSRYGTKVKAAAVRLKAQGKWTVPHWRRGHGSIWDVVVGSCPVLDSLADFMTAVFDLEDRGEFELPRKEE